MQTAGWSDDHDPAVIVPGACSHACRRKDTLAPGPPTDPGHVKGRWEPEATTSILAIGELTRRQVA